MNKTEKEELIEKITAYPLSYALLRNCFKENNWDIDKLQFMDLHQLVDINRDIFIMERNKKMLNGN
jgi:hypothetical protein